MELAKRTDIFFGGRGGGILEKKYATLLEHEAFGFRYKNWLDYSLPKNIPIE